MPTADQSRPEIEHFLGLLKARTPFTFAKINHGLWERLVAAERLIARGEADPAALDRRTGLAPNLFATGFIGELKDLLILVPELGNEFYFGAGPYAWPACGRIEGTPIAGLDRTNAVIERYVPKAAQTADPLLWKMMVHAGRFDEAVSLLRRRDVTVIGPGWLAQFGAFARLPKFRMCEIHPTNARAEREAIFDRIVAGHDPRQKPVYLISAGALSAWLAIRLHQTLPSATVIDLGEVLDLCSVSRLVAHNWAQAWRAKIADTIESINSDWPDDPRAYAPGLPLDQRQAAWSLLRHGAHPAVAKAIRIGPRTRPYVGIDDLLGDVAEIDFVEKKMPDWVRIGEITALSARVNRWANFGPVAGAFERVVTLTLNLPANRAVVATASGTAALHAVTGAYSIRAGRELRWLVSGFGFFSSKVGPLADSVVVDCDAGGMLDLELVRAMPAADWDGMIVTNIFGGVSDLGRYREFCERLGKILIVDSAAGLLSIDRRSEPYDEIISFHHTKPWGFGEGGCAIVSADCADRVRALVNFGVGAEDGAYRHATNGKMSDLAAAAIIDRLEQLPAWSFFYRQQRTRIQRLARKAGLELLAAPAPIALTNFVAVLASAPVNAEDLPKTRFAVRKYYRPLADGLPVSRALYDRILCIPCHPGMMAVPSGEIAAFTAAVGTIGNHRKVA